MKKASLITAIIAGNAIVLPFAMTSCNSNKKTQTTIEEVTKSRVITADSDKGTIQYYFKASSTNNIKETKVAITDMVVHDKHEEPIPNLVSIAFGDDAKIIVEFNTQLFIQEYLAKYYESNASKPSTYKFVLTNEKEGIRFESNTYSLTITPAQYDVLFNSGSDKLTFQDDTRSFVYKEINATYSLEAGCVLKDKTILRYDGEDLVEKTGVSFSDGQIKIPAEYVTGPIWIYATTEDTEEKFPVIAKGDAVVQFPQTIPEATENKEYKLPYQIKYGTLKTIDVKVYGESLTIDTDYTCKDGVITIKAEKVTGRITITATGTPNTYGIKYDFDDRLTYEGPSVATYSVDLSVKLHAEIGYWSITNWGCAVNGDETYTQYLLWDDVNKILTLPGKYIIGNVKMWASIA